MSENIAEPEEEPEENKETIFVNGKDEKVDLSPELSKLLRTLRNMEDDE